MVYVPSLQLIAYNAAVQQRVVDSKNLIINKSDALQKDRNQLIKAVANAALVRYNDQRYNQGKNLVRGRLSDPYEIFENHFLRKMFGIWVRYQLCVQDILDVADDKDNAKTVTLQSIGFLNLANLGLTSLRGCEKINSSLVTDFAFNHNYISALPYEWLATCTQLTRIYGAHNQLIIFDFNLLLNIKTLRFLHIDEDVLSKKACLELQKVRLLWKQNLDSQYVPIHENNEEDQQEFVQQNSVPETNYYLTKLRDRIIFLHEMLARFLETVWM